MGYLGGSRGLYRRHVGGIGAQDLYWARNRGSMSKATPHINLSEDIYLGFNVKNRGEKSDHFDFLEWEKGREVQYGIVRRSSR